MKIFISITLVALTSLLFFITCFTNEKDKNIGQNNTIFADEFIENNLGGKDNILKLDKTDLLKRLNAVVFNHCKSEVPHTGIEDINELYKTCKTACGGYSYVLRGLIEALGFKTRYINFYNLPNQGNHTCVEVEVAKDRWVFLDPTFGSFFTKNDKINGQLMSIDEVRYQPDKNALLRKVFVAVKETVNKQNKNYTKYIILDLNKIYEKNKYNFKYMKIENYLLAEQVERVGPSLIVPLVAKIILHNGSYQLGEKNFNSVKSGVDGFLKDTNKLLNDSDLSNDISFLFSKVGNYSPYFKSVNILNIEKMEINSEYNFILCGFAYNEINLHIKTIGRNLLLKNNEPIKLNPGKFSMNLLFRAKSGNGQLLLSITPSDQMIDLLYLEVTKVQ